MPLADQYDSSGFFVGERDGYGPLPEGWSATLSEPTEEELASTRIAAIDAETIALEQKAIRLLLSIALGMDEPYGHEKQTNLWHKSSP